ncbi:biotin/lipoyl-containing protein [uncultured Clostridium sp.]|uniref:biotin/lipoyl-containing protein n=1 Tax=uncultured Clostridium sp. TaxID=59620 RepID=UPI0025CDD7BA|nr:biotin/lipoyl-containing protein [uncultured Clostridium sp.]
MEYTIKAPIPGLLARVMVKEGQKVSEGDELVVINCMKTETSCIADKSGIVKQILVEEWDEIDVDTVLVILEV